MSNIIINEFERVPATLIPVDKITGEVRKDVVLNNQNWVLSPEGVVSTQQDPKDPNTVLFIPISDGSVSISASASVSLQ